MRRRMNIKRRGQGKEKKEWRYGEEGKTRIWSFIHCP
jgi:hypothetical protein